MLRENHLRPRTFPSFEFLLAKPIFVKSIRPAADLHAIAARDEKAETKSGHLTEIDAQLRNSDGGDLKDIQCTQPSIHVAECT